MNKTKNVAAGSADCNSPDLVVNPFIYSYIDMYQNNYIRDTHIQKIKEMMWWNKDHSFVVLLDSDDCNSLIWIINRYVSVV